LLNRLTSVLLLILSLISICGCQTAHYYRQAVTGELQILTHRQPIARLIADPKTPAKLREKLELVLRLRAFARKELKLPTDKHYLTYVDLHRRFAVWNVNAAPEFSLEPKKWWYPFVGSLKYRGYFSHKDADLYGDALARRGDDVYVEGVEAYSTLGWFADPLLNTFIMNPESDLAETVFHELTHQRLFLSGDTDFNEALATAVSEEGVRRWYKAKHDDAGCREYLTELRRNREFVAVVMKARHRLETVYGQTNQPGAVRQPLTRSVPARLRAEKAGVIRELRADYAQLKSSWGGYAGYDAWFALPLNNAQLNTIAVYYELVPGFQVLLRDRAGDLDSFFKAVEDMRSLSKEARHRRLRELGGTQAKLRSSEMSEAQQAMH
jgi:predicted aminopeptidase